MDSLFYRNRLYRCQPEARNARPPTGTRAAARPRVLSDFAASIVAYGVRAAAAVWRSAGSATNWISFSVDGLRYEVSLPRHYVPTKHYPVLLYLHQYNMGNYRKGLLRQVDAWFGSSDFRTRHPAIIVLPMLNQTKDPGANFGGKRAGRCWQDATIAALGQVMERYSADPDRIYVTGNSLGGMGTWDMLLSYNAKTGTKGRIFAAGMPLAGRHHTADPAEAARALRTVPIWVIHGTHDAEEPLEWDRTMARLLSDSDTFRYTEETELGHDVWSHTYGRAEIWDWLFRQRRGQ